MNYYKHLIKLNNIRNGGSVIGLWRLLAAYNLRFFFCRPALVKLLFADCYRTQKKLLYTILVGDYDQLNEIPEKLPNWDYACFTDNTSLTSNTWEIRLLENEFNLDPVRLSRHFKINNHLIDSDHDLSVYVDANIRIRGDLDCFLAHALVSGSSFSILLHPFLHSLEEEVERCVTIGKDDEKILRQQYEHYTAEKGFSDQFPHINARMMIRRSGAPEVRRLMEKWFAQLKRWSSRDQVAFNYSLSCCPDITVDYIPYWIFRRYFKTMDHQ